MQLLENLFLLIFGHALADFVLQPEVMGYGKNRNNEIHREAQTLFPNWFYWMSAHAVVHGGIVYIITGSLAMGVLETLIHGLTDYSKCEGRISMHQDQVIHIGCKAGYAVFM